MVRVPLVVREGLSGGTRVDYFLKVNFLFSVCNILFQLVQHSLTLSLLQVIISAFRVYCRTRYLAARNPISGIAAAKVLIA